MSLPAAAAKQHKLIRVKEEVSQKPEFPPFVSRALSRFQETHGGGGVWWWYNGGLLHLLN